MKIGTSITFYHPDFTAVVTGKTTGAVYSNSGNDCVDVVWNDSKRPVTLRFDGHLCGWVFYDYAYPIAKLFDRDSMVMEVAVFVRTRAEDMCLFDDAGNFDKLKNVDEIDFKALLEAMYN